MLLKQGRVARNDATRRPLGATWAGTVAEWRRMQVGASWQARPPVNHPAAGPSAPALGQLVAAPGLDDDVMDHGQAMNRARFLPDLFLDSLAWAPGPPGSHPWRKP